MKREWLIKQRASMQKTQQDVADACQVSRAYYTQIESGSRRPSPELAIQLGQILKVDWTRFFQEDDKQAN